MYIRNSNPNPKKTKVNTRKSNKFAGADDVYLTKTKIAVRRVRTTDKGISDDTTYYPKNKNTMSLLGRIFGHVRFGRK